MTKFAKKMADNGYDITPLPTLINVEKFNLTELREHYKRLEGESIDQAQLICELKERLHSMTSTAHVLSSAIYALCDSFEAGDQAAILLQVRKLAEQRKANAVKYKMARH